MGGRFHDEHPGSRGYVSLAVPLEVAPIMALLARVSRVCVELGVAVEAIDLDLELADEIGSRHVVTLAWS